MSVVLATDQGFYVEACPDLWCGTPTLVEPGAGTPLSFATTADAAAFRDDPAHWPLALLGCVAVDLATGAVVDTGPYGGPDESSPVTP